MWSEKKFFSSLPRAQHLLLSQRQSVRIHRPIKSKLSSSYLMLLYDTVLYVTLRRLELFSRKDIRDGNVCTYRNKCPYYFYIIYYSLLRRVCVHFYLYTCISFRGSISHARYFHPLRVTFGWIQMQCVAIEHLSFFFFFLFLRTYSESLCSRLFILSLFFPRFVRIICEKLVAVLLPLHFFLSIFRTCYLLFFARVFVYHVLKFSSIEK